VISIRPPFFGVISARGTIAVNIVPPLAETEQLLIVTTTPGDVVAKVMTPDSVVISVKAERAVAYIGVFIPAAVIAPPAGSWQDLMTEIWPKIRGAMKR